MKIRERRFATMCRFRYENVCGIFVCNRPKEKIAFHFVDDFCVTTSIGRMGIVSILTVVTIPIGKEVQKCKMMRKFLKSI